MDSKGLVCLLLSFISVIGSPLNSCPGNYLVDPAVTNFRRYIQIDTSKEHNLGRAVEFWRKQADELGLPFHVFRPNKLPICVITVLGNYPSLPSILLNSHMDVVPAIEEEWTYPPYSAYIDANGDIYGRGTQDCKDVAIQYIEAVRRLRRDNITLNRTLHITLMPDEESGGFNGMKALLKTEVLKTMNPGFALDEGIPSADDSLMVTYQDRRPWQFKVTVYGEGGHGYSMPDSTAMEKATKFMSIVNTYRNRMKALVRGSGPEDYGRHTSININMIEGGYLPNAIPSHCTMVVDMRLATTANVTEIERMIMSWVSEAGNGTELSFIRRDNTSKKTVLDDSNEYWVAMRNAINGMGIKAIPVVLPATSDMLVLRELGIPAVGLSAKARTVPRAHGKDEYINAITFLREIDIYYEVLKSVGNVPDFDGDGRGPC